ncbi:MAG TPA: hypothetical protein VGL05_18545 [Kribbella sp.]
MVLIVVLRFLRRIGDTWTLATMSRLVEGPRRFTELQKETALSPELRTPRCHRASNTP